MQEASEPERGLSPAAKCYLSLMRDPAFGYPHLLAAAAATLDQTPHESENDAEPQRAGPWPAPSRSSCEWHPTSRKLLHSFGGVARWPEPLTSPSVGPGGELPLGRPISLDRAVHIGKRRPTVRGAAAVWAAIAPGPGTYGTPSRPRGCPSSPSFSPCSRLQPSRPASSPPPCTQASYSPRLHSLSGARAPGARSYSFPSAPRHLCPRPDGTDRPPPLHGDRTPPAVGPGKYTNVRARWDTGGGKWGSGPGAGMIPVPAGPGGHGALGPGTHKVAEALAFGTSPAGAAAPAFFGGRAGARPLPRRPTSGKSGARGVAGQSAGVVAAARAG
jgi:hypothetical protein